MKKVRMRRILIIGAAVVCLLAALLILGTCGGGTLHETRQWLFLASTPVVKTGEASYAVEAGLQVYDVEALQVSVAAATPWGVLLRFRIPEGMEAKWFAGAEDTEAQAATAGPATKWRFLSPGEALKVYAGLAGRPGEGITLTYTYLQDAYAGYERVYTSASWAYHYHDVAELAQASDLIACVSIDQPEKDDSYVVSGIQMTAFPATVQECIYGEDEKEIRLVMTGGIDEQEKKIYEIEDDPLMKKGDEYLIFARKNADGTYTILGGPQGRFVLEDGKVYPLSEANTILTADGMAKDEFLEEIVNALR